ncbi:MAG: hypothetical protein GYB67_11640 [Chloroflexi bacterium]|nr:hypothetical protein [Chloroflexota bacterium]
MPIDFWIDPEQPDLFRWKFTGGWTLSEYFPINDRANRLVIERAPNPVYVIVDMLETDAPPDGFLSGLSSTNNRGPDNWVLTVIVAQSRLYTSLLEVARKADKRIMQRYRVVRSLEDAHTAIAAAHAARNHEALDNPDRR